MPLTQQVSLSDQFQTMSLGAQTTISIDGAGNVRQTAWARKARHRDIMRNTRLGTFGFLPPEIRHLIWDQVIEEEKHSIINHHKKWHRFSCFETKLERVDGDLVFLTDVICKFGDYFHNQPPPRSLLAHAKIISPTIEGEIMQLLELALIRQKANIRPYP